MPPALFPHSSTKDQTTMPCCGKSSTEERSDLQAYNNPDHPCPNCGVSRLLIERQVRNELHTWGHTGVCCTTDKFCHATKPVCFAAWALILILVGGLLTMTYYADHLGNKLDNTNGTVHDLLTRLNKSEWALQIANKKVETRYNVARAECTNETTHMKVRFETILAREVDSVKSIYEKQLGTYVVYILFFAIHTICLYILSAELYNATSIIMQERAESAEAYYHEFVRKMQKKGCSTPDLPVDNQLEPSLREIYEQGHPSTSGTGASSKAVFDELVGQ